MSAKPAARVKSGGRKALPFVALVAVALVGLYLWRRHAANAADTGAAIQSYPADEGQGNAGSSGGGGTAVASPSGPPHGTAQVLATGVKASKVGSSAGHKLLLKGSTNK